MRLVRDACDRDLAMTKSFILLSPEFSSRAGHQAEYIAQMAAAARRSGFTVRVVAPTDCSIQIDNASVERILSPLNTAPAPSHFAARAIARIRRTLDQHRRRAAYRALFAQGNTEALWFLHTAPYPEIALAIEAFMAAPMGRLAVMMRSDHDNVPARMEQIRQALSRAEKGHVDLWADTVDLAEALTPLAPYPVGCSPPPWTGRIPTVQPVRGRIGVFGARRRQKGYTLLEPIAHVAQARQTGLAFVVHGYAHRELSVDPDLDTTTLALCELGVSVIDEILPTAAMEDEIAACSAVLLPYDPTIYRRGSSGMFVQAIAMGRAAVVSEGTWMAAEARRIGLSRVIAVDPTDPEATTGALITAACMGIEPFTPTAPEAAWIRASLPDNVLKTVMAGPR